MTEDNISVSVVFPEAAYAMVPILTKFIDKNFAREGYGFVTPSQLTNEINRGSVFIATNTVGQVVGVRVGKATVYNLCVAKECRHNGIGRRLLEYSPPENIRVKSKPVGHLSKDQLHNFSNPEGFYQKCGFDFLQRDFSRNFFAGDTKDGKRVYYKQGVERHIRIYTRSYEVDFLVRCEEYAIVHHGYKNARGLISECR